MIHFNDMDLRLFLAVESQGSLSIGAQLAGLSPSAASSRLNNLEKQLGVKLFERLPRGVRLTREGAHFSSFAREIACRLESLESVLRPYRVGRTAIRIATNANALETFLPRDIGAFMMAHPEVAVEVEKFDLNWMLLQAVASGEFDLGVTAYEGVHPELVFETYRTDTMAVVMPSGHRWAAEEGIAFEAFREMPFIQIGSRSALGIFLENKAREYGFRLDVRSKVPSYEAALELVAQEVGMTVLPLSMQLASDTASRVSMRVLTDEWAERRLRLCWKKGREGPAMLGLMVRSLIRN